MEEKIKAIKSLIADVDRRLEEYQKGLKEIKGRSFGRSFIQSQINCLEAYKSCAETILKMLEEE